METKRTNRDGNHISTVEQARTRIRLKRQIRLHLDICTDETDLWRILALVEATANSQLRRNES